MSGGKRPDRDQQRGISRAFRTIYEPELAAQARFDLLLDRLKNVPGTNTQGGGNERSI